MILYDYSKTDEEKFSNCYVCYVTGIIISATADDLYKL